VPSHPFFRSPVCSVAGALFVGGSLVVAVLVVRGQLATAAGELAGQRLLPLLLAAACALLVPATTAAAWRSVLASCGVALRATDAWGCYGLGCLANTFLPGRAGDALRVELFSRRLDHERRRWLACGVSTTVGLAQSAVLGAVLVAGAVAGALPVWLAVPAVALPAALWGGGRLALRLHPEGRVACLATSATLTTGAWVRLSAWIGAGALARLLVLASVLDALSAPHPVAAAVVAVCGLTVGGAVPLAPGAAGLAAATMTVALGHAGIDTSTALAAAVSFHAFETGSGLLFAASGWVALRLTPARVEPLAQAAVALATGTA
jgi:uncharacterized membrane protein YbhN (UPF0104 family)